MPSGLRSSCPREQTTRNSEAAALAGAVLVLGLRACRPRSYTFRPACRGAVAEPLGREPDRHRQWHDLWHADPWKDETPYAVGGLGVDVAGLEPATSRV